MDKPETIRNILTHNASFVENKDYIPFETDKFPNKKIAVVSCMDTRLTELLPQALGLRNGDAKIIKVAGGEVTEPYGSVMRSLLVGVYELGVEDILVIAHTSCGAQHMNGADMAHEMIEAGIRDEQFEQVKAAGINLDEWLEGFGDTEAAVGKSVMTIRNHPLMTPQVRVWGFVIDSTIGKLTSVEV